MFGIVVIGRNEHTRLEGCLRSVLREAQPSLIVYVDSGSSDGSVERAKSLGVNVVELNADLPFTAARARNAGLAFFADSVPFVQFLDGDCELVEGWMQTAITRLQEKGKLAVVCGRRREKSPGTSIYNRLCDLEWNTPAGVADACGGDAMIRVSSLRQIGGYDATLVAGEDPEMCVRLRNAGWMIERLDTEMTLHDAAMTRFSQWWRRMLRAGHAYAEIHAMHPDMWAHQVRSNWAWGLAAPLTALSLGWWTRGISFAAAILCYAILWIKVARCFRKTAETKDNHFILYSSFTVLAKIPLAVGQMRYFFNRLRRRRSTIIEYKKAEAIA